MYTPFAMRLFNTSGSCIEGDHYMLPPERRLGECAELIDKKAYFVVHAPRQTGKTTSMKALAKRLTAEGRYAALWFSCEEAGTLGEDLDDVERAIWGAVESSARRNLAEPLRPPAREAADTGRFLGTQLARWAESCPRPLVLVFDEIDSLAGNGLITVLRQLRAGYTARPSPFPWSVILCGMRDVRDYKAASGGGPVRIGSSSPFNVKAESLRLGNFTEPEIHELYGQHTADTGQVFTEDALDKAWALTQGQPWLVNALAREVVEKMKVPAAQPVTGELVDQAKERLILTRATHLDSLLARLREEPVRKILEPILAGELPGGTTFDADFEYVVDLGLVATGLPPRIANPIYREIIVRVLGNQAEAAVIADPRSYVASDGTLDIRRLLEDFAEFWRQHGDILTGRFDYREVAPQLILMAYLHRIVNSGGYIDREVGVGRKRIDLLVRWPYAGPDGKRAEQRAAMELKVWRDRDKKGDPLPQGLKQIDDYLAQLGLDEGTLVIFDCRTAAEPIEDRTQFDSTKTPSGRHITLLRA